MRLPILLAALMMSPTIASQPETKVEEQQEHIQCIKCRHIINDNEDFQLVAICNILQYTFPLCLKCADDYNEMYANMLVQFLETERQTNVDPSQCN